MESKAVAKKYDDLKMILTLPYSQDLVSFFFFSHYLPCTVNNRLQILQVYLITHLNEPFTKYKWINLEFALEDMKERLKNLTAHGDLTPEQRSELERLALENADALNETDKAKMLAEHESRIRALEEKMAQLLGESTEPPTDENGDTVLPEYVAGKWYYAGDVVMWNGKAYTCTAPEGVVCVWSPDDYPAYWQEVA